MATRTIPKKAAPPNIYVNLAIKHAPVLAPALTVVLAVSFLIWPAFARLERVSHEISEKETAIITATRSNADLDNMQKDLEIFKGKVVEFESRLPKRLKTTLIIETLQEITKQSKLKFNSLEPAPIKRYVLEETKDVFVELPVRVRLNCGYWDLIDFLAKIETANQLMKITDLVIRKDPASEWDQQIEFTISAFSKGGSSE